MIFILGCVCGFFAGGVCATFAFIAIAGAKREPETEELITVSYISGPGPRCC